MSEFQTKKLNNEVVKTVPLLEAIDTRPVKGAALFPEIYANVFLCAKKKSGKTSAVYKIVKKCAGPKTKIVVFCSTLHKDPSWATIQALAEARGWPFVGHTSLKDDDGTDLLDELIHDLEAGEPIATKKERSPLDSEDEEEVERKPKYRAPEYLIILDDLSTELKSTSVTALLKKNRHFKAKIILSSQYLNDLLPAARKQLDYCCLFKGHSLKKIEEVHRDLDVSIPVDEFYRVYKFATEEPFSFLYVDTVSGTFRRNFNVLIEV